MDWYAWLSQTNLDASLIYEYGLALVRNEVGEEDLPYFNHDFLQSLGISVARHRLEILKLCAGRNGLSLSRLVLVMNNTRKLFARKLGFRRNPPPPEVSPYRSRRNVMWSGPLDRRFMDFKMHPNWSPMPRQSQRQRPGLVCPSPALSGPMDRLGLSPKLAYYRPETMDDNQDHDHDHDGAAHSLWSIMFQDMKPT